MHLPQWRCFPRLSKYLRADGIVLTCMHREEWGFNNERSLSSAVVAVIMLLKLDACPVIPNDYFCKYEQKGFLYLSIDQEDQTE